MRLCVVVFSTFFVIEELDLVSLEDACLDVVGVVFVDTNIAVEIVEPFFYSIENIGIEPGTAVGLEFEFEFKIVGDIAGVLENIFGAMKITHTSPKSLCAEAIWETSFFDRC
jgi:hypothetical protein